MIIKDSYINEEEKLLIDILSRAYPDKDFEPGSNYNELLIKPLAMMFATIKMYLVQSNQIANILAYDAKSFNGDLELAMRAVLRNWLLTPSAGTPATGFVSFIVSTDMSPVTVSPMSRFVRGSVTYKINSDVPITISPAELIPQFDSSGSVLFYRTPPVQIISTASSADANIPKGSTLTILSRAGMSDNVTGVETVTDIIGGSDPQKASNITREDILNALTVRNMISRRSVITTLLANFPDLIDVVPIGFKDPEMSRNKIELYGKFYRIGGCDDIYVFRPPYVKIASGTLGSPLIFSDTIGPNNILIIDNVDPSILDPSVDLGTAYVRVTGPAEYNKKCYPDTYIIERVFGVTPDRRLVLQIAPACPEKWAFDPGYVSIGHDENSFSDILDANHSAVIENVINTVGSCIILNYPVLSIKSVSIYDPQNPSADPTTGYLELSKTTADTVDPGSYKVVIPDKNRFNSYGNNMLIVLNSNHVGKPYRVEYLTFNMDDIGRFVTSDNMDILAIDRLVRSKYLVEAFLFVQYSTLKGVAFNIEAVKQALSNFVNTFDFTNNTLNIDLLKTIVYNSGASSVGMTMNYSIMAPNGKIISFSSSNIVDLSIDNLSGTSEGDLTDLGYISKRLIQLYLPPENIRMQVA